MSASKSSKPIAMEPATITDTKRGRGQPTKYDPGHCEQVIAWGKEGKSLEWMCAELGVVYNTLTANWPKANPEFGDALELSQLLALKWWEDKGQDGLSSRDFNANVYARSMAARFPKKWRETKGHELTGKDGAPLALPDISNPTSKPSVIPSSR